MKHNLYLVDVRGTRYDDGRIVPEPMYRWTYYALTFGGAKRKYLSAVNEYAGYLFDYHQCRPRIIYKNFKEKNVSDEEIGFLYIASIVLEGQDEEFKDILIDIELHRIEIEE